MRKIAALFVQTGGAYFGDETIDPWDESRDARKYEGPFPVVAHPPCARWCKLAPVNEVRYGLKIGDDGGCFESALKSVRKWGGVLEHPAQTIAWERFGLGKPDYAGGWEPAGDDLGFVCYVEQGRYGHVSRKGTWLYAVRCRLPDLRWGYSKKWEGLTIGGSGKRFKGRHSSKKSRNPTPNEFKKVLVGMARSVV